jgi:hypothetical protein
MTKARQKKLTNKGGVILKENEATDAMAPMVHLLGKRDRQVRRGGFCSRAIDRM